MITHRRNMFYVKVYEDLGGGSSTHSETWQVNVTFKPFHSQIFSKSWYTTLLHADLGINLVK
jgi:hypothetical protein